MRRFTNILFTPAGRHDNASAVRRVADLARDNGARLTLFGVTPQPSRLQRALHRADFFAEVQAADRTAMSNRLERYAAAQDDLEIEVAVETGDHAVCVLDRVASDGHDLVVVTTTDEHDGHATIKRLLRSCPCPVWVIRPTRARIQRVLAAVNPDPAERELNVKILELAAGMVDRFGGELHVVHAWELYGEATLRQSAFLHMDDDAVDALADEEHDRLAAALADLLDASGLDQAPWTVHLVKGRPEDIVCRLVERARINLLVMGTIARSGVSGVMIGNTAERVLDDVRCSVVAIKPPGFGAD
jgi:nucleotide-binding universal stress UspA family protein